MTDSFQEGFEPGYDGVPNTGFQFFKKSRKTYVFGPDWEGPSHLKTSLGFEWNPSFEMRCRRILDGETNLQIIKEIGGGRSRMSLLRKILVHINGEIFCKCGRPSNHMGHCKFRYEVNPRLKSSWRSAQLLAYIKTTRSDSRNQKLIRFKKKFPWMSKSPRRTKKAINQNNASQYLGVSRDGVKFRARIQIFGKTISIGWFANEEDAARAYDNKLAEHFGDSARLNFPKEATR